MQNPTTAAAREAAAKSIDRLPDGMSRSRVFTAAQSAEFVGFSLPHWRRLYRAKKVPSPIQIGERKLGWQAGVLIDWLASRQRAAL